MKTSFSISRFGGINISIHWTFIVLAIWIFLVNFSNASVISGLIWSAVLLITLFASILVHELAHLVAANYFGLYPSAIVILPIGGVASMTSKARSHWHEFFILLAGPLANLVIACLLMFFIHPYQAYWNESENIGVVNAENFLFQLQVINLSLAILNLIPAFPMDGGRMVRTVLSIKMNAVNATSIEKLISTFIAFALIISGIFVVNFYIIVFGLFVLATINAVKAFPSENMQSQTKRRKYKSFQGANVNE